MHNRIDPKVLPPSKWLVVNTLPHRETYARDNLARQDFLVYCPMIAKRIRHARRVFDAPRPLFPSYIFVEHRHELERWRPILGTHGVKTLVRSGEQPGFVEGSFIDGLKARENDGVIGRPAVTLVVGQKVAVHGGPFDGLIGEVIELREKTRVMVLLNLLYQQTKTHLRTDMLDPL